MASSASTKKRQGLGSLEDGGGRSHATKPQLLTQLPGSLFTSPGFIMGLIAFEFLYALFLFAVMSSNKRHREEARIAAELQANAGLVEPPLAPKIEPEVRREPITGAEPTAKPETTASKPEPAPVEPEPAKTSSSASATVAQAKKAADEPPPTSSSKPKVNPQGDNSKKAVALATPEPTPTKVEAVVEKSPLSLFPELGPLIDPLQDSRLKAGDDALTLQIAAGAHIFDPARDIADAPRALAEVDGDFTAEVKFLGELQPGTEPLPGLPFTFQGAGLLLWQDKENYVRFERASAYMGDRFQWLYLESCKEGKITKPKKPMNVRKGAVTLRLERHGNVINYSYSLEGKPFIKVDQLATGLPRRVSVGISANNASPRAFSAKFTDFVLKPAS